MYSLCAPWSPPCHLLSAFINQTVSKWRSELPNAFIHCTTAFLLFFFFFNEEIWACWDFSPNFMWNYFCLDSATVYKSLMLQAALFAPGGVRQLNPHCLSLAVCGRRGTALGKIQMGTEGIRAVLVQGLAAPWDIGENFISTHSLHPVQEEELVKILCHPSK